jgi:hypothetical protein
MYEATAASPSDNNTSARTIESPPPTPQPARSSSNDDPRSRLHRLAMQLLRTQNRRLLVEFLTLRRTMR